MAAGGKRSHLKIFLIDVISPLVATSIAACLSVKAGVPLISFATNIAGLVVGSLLFFIFKQLDRSKWRCAVIAFGALGIIATSFIFPGIDGVHRWIGFGPLIFNASMAFGPLLLYCFYRSLEKASWLSIFISTGVTTIHSLQPDAGQMTSLAVGFFLILILKKVSPGRSWIHILILLAGIVFTWSKLDPLGAVPQVERIMQLMTSQGLIGWMALVVALGFTFFPFARAILMGTEDKLMVSVTACYLFAQFVVTQFGNFPVPVLGAGAASMTGYLLLRAVSSFSVNRPLSPRPHWPLARHGTRLRDMRQP